MEQPPAAAGATCGVGGQTHSVAATVSVSFSSSGLPPPDQLRAPPDQLLGLLLGLQDRGEPRPPPPVRSSWSRPPARELTISPLILPWWYQIPTQCKRPKVLLVHALPRGHLSSSPDALLPILSSRPPQLCQLRHARLLPPPTGDSIQTLRLRWPCPQTLRAAERVDVQRSARALNRSPHYAEPCRLRPLVRLAFDPLTVMWFPPAGRWR
jgi:hypothetical protein